MTANYIRVAVGKNDPGWVDERVATRHRGPICPSRLKAEFGAYVCSLREGHDGTHLAGIGRGVVTAEWTNQYAEAGTR
jgi:hypothetical protein